MKKLKLILLFIALQFATQIAQAQIPINDSAWVLQTAYSDDFDSTGLRPSRWDINDDFQTDGAEIAYSHNVSLTGPIYSGSNGYLKLKTDSLTQLNWKRKYKPLKAYPGGDDCVTVVYEGGRLNTKYLSGGVRYSPYKYGYLEVSAKYPKGHLNQWPAFWVWEQDKNCTTPSLSWYNEIDITENGGDASASGYTESNIHINTNTLSSCTSDFINSNVDGLYQQPGLADTNFHKYAVYWDPSQVTYYFDDVAWRTETNNLPTHGMDVILMSEIYPWNAYLPSDWDRSHTTPADTSYGFWAWHLDHSGFNSARYFWIDYVHYYKLDSTQCNNTKSICNPNADYNTGIHKRAVYKNITTGSGCNPVFNTSNEYTLRATDYILLDGSSGGSTTINSDGSGQFSIVITPCPN